MSKPGPRKSKLIDPRIVIVGVNGTAADVALKGFIDDWFVPALVEEYIRQHHRPPKPECGDVYSGRKPGDGHRR